MGAPSRRKGANGERDFRNLLRRFGFACDRDGSALGDLRHDVPGVHFEVKRCEVLAIPKWLRQAETDAVPLAVPVVAFRRSREPWRVVAPATEYLRLKALERALRVIVADLEGCERASAVVDGPINDERRRILAIARETLEQDAA